MYLIHIRDEKDEETKRPEDHGHSLVLFVFLVSLVFSSFWSFWSSRLSGLSRLLYSIFIQSFHLLNGLNHERSPH